MSKIGYKVLLHNMLRMTMLMGIMCSGISVFTSCSESQGLKVVITNPTQEVRTQEMSEIATALVFERLALKDTDQFVIYDEEGNEIPYQITYDDKVIFPVDVDSMAIASYTFQKGEPQMVATQVVGIQYPEWQDDLTWENDKMAYRVYGPDVQKRGEKLFGYDIFTKNVSEPVMESRYGLLLNKDIWKNINELREKGQKELADSLENSISYHADHGTGMDCYKVGATLGAGTAALMNGKNILYPYCYKDFEILDNGPLRYTMKLRYNPMVVKNDTCVVETRIIQLDKGLQLNKTTITYEYLTERQTLAVGLAIHEPWDNRYVMNAQEGYMAYADPTSNVTKGNGIVYVGAVFPKNVSEMKVQSFEKVRDGALGHVLTLNDYIPGDDFVYYWGAGWSKAGFDTDDDWINYLKDFAKKIRTPLIVTIE